MELALAFHDVRLPDDVEQGATGGPTFLTTIIPMSNGSEQRNINWSETQHAWELSYGIQTADDFSITRAFFFARRGQANSFRFKDWSDFQLTDEAQGIGDGTNRVFQLIKTYETDGPAPYVRRITRSVTGTVVWKADGVPITATDNGAGMFTLASAPANGQVVTADAEFDIPVRFNVDQFALQLTLADAGAIGSLPVIEVRE
jgi:uncharacterized protein (TIGR02217 family)